VDAGSVAQIALTEVRACHVGTLYQEDNGGTVVIGSVVTCPDSDGDGLPDAWEMANFGTLAYSQNGDYDGDGVSNSDEYSFGTDPNTISFVLVVNSQYVNFTSVPVQLDVTGGVPSSQAILVDSTNFAGATWTAYTSSNLTVTLPATEGWHEVWVGLRGRLATSEQTWQWRRFKLDQTPPAVVVTNPPSTVTQPMIQLQGYSPEALSAISCDVSNALGVFSDQVILVLDSHYDTNTYEFTTNTFQGFDLRLASGVNTITIQATDLAGNLTTTNFNFTLVSNSIAPLVQLWWPQDGAQLMGDTFTWRGLVDDFTAGLTATVVDASGNTNVSSATVERDGKFWFEDLPLADGASTVTLTAVDYWGNITTTNISVTKSSVELTIDPIDENELDETPITVTGTINVSNHAVWVNGVRATLNGDDTWRAENVPLPPGGTAVFQARAIPDTDHEGNGDPGSGSGGASASMQNPGNPTSPQQKDKGKEQDEQARIYIDKDDVNSQHSDRKVRFDYFDGSGSPDGWNTMEVWDDYEQHWTHDLQKAEKGHGTGKKDHHEHYEYSTGLPVTYNPCPSTFVWPVTGAPNSADLTSCDNSHHAIAAPPLASEHCEVNNPPPASGDFWNLFEPPYFHSHWNYISYTRKAQTKWKVFTGGKTKSARDALWRFGGTAAEVLDKRAQRPFTATRSIDNSQIKVFGKTLPSDGIIFKTLPNGQYMDVPVEVTGAGGDFYTFTPSGIRHDLTNAYECPIGNADERDVGVGEIVGYAFNPPLPQNSPAAWGVDGGALSGSTGNSTTYTATDTQTSAAYVKATVRGETIIDVFDVLVPSGAHAETLSKTRYDIEKAGAGMNLRVILEPTSVSFHWIQVFEVGQPATGTSGYFVDHPPPAHDTDHRANQWYPVDCSNVIGNGFDSAYSPQYNSWYEGQFTWEIPVKWKVAGGQEHTLMSQWDQVFHLYNDGTMTVTKFNHTVTRHTNQEYGAVVPDP
jgi:hypothetical protein